MTLKTVWFSDLAPLRVEIQKMHITVPLRFSTVSALLLVSFGAFHVHAQSEVTKTVGGTTYTLSRVADLPSTGDTDTTPKSPRGDVLQIGNDLWFTTYNGGEYAQGAILSYSLTTNTFTTQYSLGRSIPSDPLTTGYTGQNPWKNTLALGPNGTLLYSGYSGGFSGTNSPYVGGGAVGIFNPATVATTGVTVLWSGGTANSSDPKNFYNGPAYVPTATGSSLYQITYGGGSLNYGTLQKISLDTNGAFVSATQLADFTGPNGRQIQGGLTVASNIGKVFFTSGTTTSPGLPTLNVIDTATDTMTVLSTEWFAGAAASGGWSSPIYDAARNSVFTLTLNGRILEWDIDAGSGGLLPILGDGGSTTAPGNSFFADPVLFGNSIYFTKQSVAATGGQLWRYDLDAAPGTQNLFQLFNINEVLGLATSQSGSLTKVTEPGGTEGLYFLTAEDSNLANNGALFKLVVVPEPASALLICCGAALFLLRRRSMVS